MKIVSLPRLTLLAGCTALIGVGVVLADGTAPATKGAFKADLTKAPINVQVNLNDFRHNKRTPIKHKPLEMKDPRTGKPLKPDDPIKLPNGKTMKARDFFARANKFEEHLNAIGHSLSDRTGGSIVLHEANVPQAELKKQADALKKAHVAFNPQTMKAMPKAADIAAQHAAGLKSDPQRMQALANPSTGAQSAKPSHTVKNWNYTVGKQSLVAGFIDGKLEVDGDANQVKLSAEGNAGGYVMNHRMVLLQAKASATSPMKGPSRATLNVLVMGHSIYNVDQSINTNWNLNKSLSKTFDYGTTIHFSIGPIPISGKLGARGSAGIKFTAAIRPAHATVQINPHVDAKAYAQVGVDLGIASAGVGGQLTLINADSTLGAELGLDIDSQRGPYLSEHFYFHNKLEMLSGKLYLYAKVDYFIGSHEWDMNLWNSKGIRVDSYLFNVTNKTYLVPNYQSAQK